MAAAKAAASGTSLLRLVSRGEQPITARVNGHALQFRHGDGTQKSKHERSQLDYSENHGTESTGWSDTWSTD